MSRYALLIEYDGTGFEGFQRQHRYSDPAPRASVTRGRGSARSVQEEIERKLSHLLDDDIRLTAAGRTDTGVHATAQVITFATARARSVPELVRGANALLDPRVRVRSAEIVADDFNPRFEAELRTYHYYFLPGYDHADPFLGRMVWNFYQSVDLEAMRRAARGLIGSHDFAAYGRGLLEGEITRRDMKRLEILECGQAIFAPGPFRRLEHLVCVEIQANAFLRRMARQIVANLVRVGLGQWPEDEPVRILHGKDVGASAPPAPAHALFLVEVAYAGCNLPALNQAR
jgi:tRNA pseudouridine38-40 synthase